MIIKRALGAGFIGVVVLVFASYFVVKPKAGGLMQPGTTVPVGLNNCKVTPDTVTIRVNGQVEWTATDKDYNLVFLDSPFTGIPSGASWTVPQGHPRASGAAACSGPTPCTRKYTVKASGGCDLDPKVIIQH